MSRLEIVVDNTKIGPIPKFPLMIECFRCKHKWNIDLNDVIDEVLCPVCDGVAA